MNYCICKQPISNGIVQQSDNTCFENVFSWPNHDRSYHHRRRAHGPLVDLVSDREDVADFLFCRFVVV